MGRMRNFEFIESAVFFKYFYDFVQPMIHKKNVYK